LIFFDIDRFKSNNDIYGHKKGDHVLQRVAELVSKNIRATDRLFRWGGEEFVILLPGADLTCARFVAEKVRDIIAEYDFGIAGRLTVSFGIGEYAADEDADQIVSRLDKALYEAKLQGGNRVVACPA
jgi:diguanylate cyclase (GGDEF)-like protein